jgi:hypothetical protein
MKKDQVIKILALGLGCAVLVSGSNKITAQSTLPATAANLVGNGGITFVFAPTSDPSAFTITSEGEAYLSLLGNCSEHAQLVAHFPTSAGQLVALSGTVMLTSSEGANSVTFSVTGTATPDPANAAFFNNTYQVTFTGGTGAFVSARGSGSISEVVKFSSALAGTGTWAIKGYVVHPPQGP